LDTRTHLFIPDFCGEFIYRLATAILGYHRFFYPVFVHPDFMLSTCSSWMALRKPEAAVQNPVCSLLFSFHKLRGNPGYFQVF
jgi:hypothetical protein